MWGQMEQESGRMLQIAQATIEQTQGETQAFQDSVQQRIHSTIIGLFHLLSPWRFN